MIFSYRGGRADLLREIAAGTAPDEFLYGMAQVGRAGFIESSAESNWLSCLLRPLELLTARMGFPVFLGTPLRNLRTLRSCRLVVATTDSIGIPLLILKGLGALAAQVIVISQGLHSIERRALKKALGVCLAKASAIVVLGDGDALALREAFATSALPELVTIQFGIDHAFWRPGEGSQIEGFVLSVGSDRLRDYPTLLEAIGDTSLKLVTRTKLPEHLLRPNISIQSELSWPELRSLYRRSNFVVTPVKGQKRDSGHSATLQAMACAKAVILSDTAGLWDRSNMKHGETCYLVEPGCVTAMRDAIEWFWANPEEAARIGRNARKLVESTYNSAAFGSRLSALIETRIGS